MGIKRKKYLENKVLCDKRNIFRDSKLNKKSKKHLYAGVLYVPVFIGVWASPIGTKFISDFVHGIEEPTFKEVDEETILIKDYLSNGACRINLEEISPSAGDTLYNLSQESVEKTSGDLSFHQSKSLIESLNEIEGNMIYSNSTYLLPKSVDCNINYK